MAISDLNAKYHIKLSGNGFTLAHATNGRMLYEKKPAPSFVNKTSSGDSSYRDASFWQFWAQINWRNGAKQERFDDGGKFWKSSDIDATQSEKVRLSKLLVSAGQAVAGETAMTSVAWRGTQSWWDANYAYRQNLTVTAPVGVAVPENYPIKIDIDTGALQTGGKVRSDRKDWRVVFWNGSIWVDLTRHYVSTTATFFPLQTALTAGTSDSNYYVYYGYASESTAKQPTDDATWNSVYYPKDEDSFVLGLWHAKEGTGTTVEDTSGNNLDMTYISGGNAWVSNAKLGFAIDGGVYRSATSATLNVGSFTLEFVYKADGTSGDNSLFELRVPGGGGEDKFGIMFHNTNMEFYKQAAGGTQSVTFSTALLDSTNYYHYAITFDGATTAKLYRSGVLVSTQTFSVSGIRSTAATALNVGIGSTATLGNMQHIRFDSVARTSFAGALTAEPTFLSAGEETTQPIVSSFTLYTGFSNGKIYSWDGISTFTEVFDTNRLTWFETGTDSNKVVGDVGGVETAQSQGFQVAVAQKMQVIEVNLKKAAGTPGDITVRIETDNAGVPSGTLVDSNAATTIPAFTDASYVWKTATFPAAFALGATTLYHLVLKTATAANDNNYTWAADASSPGYTGGAMSTSTDGGGTWSAVAGADAYFRVNAQTTSVYSSLVSSVGGTQRMYWGVGNINSQTNGDARIYSYNGQVWALTKTFTTANDTSVTALAEYGGSVFAATGPQARIYSTPDVSTWTLSKQIRTPQNPGFVYAMREYNFRLYAGGGSPEYLSDQKYNGFLYYFDGSSWNSLYPFEHTVVTALGSYDAFLFIGTYHGQVYIYDTSTLDPLINFGDDYEYKVQISDFAFFDDKIFMLLAPQDNSGDTNSALWMFERHGISAYSRLPAALSLTKFKHSVIVNNALMLGTDNGYMFQLDRTQYMTPGYYQSSYFDALLPSINKLYNQLIVQTDPLPTGTSVTVEYKFKESDSWTSLGTINTDGATSTAMDFATGVYSKKISFKYTLTTPNSTITPTIRETVLKYTLFPDRKWQWNMRLLIKGTTARDKIILLDKTQDTRTSAQLRALVEGLLASLTLMPFYDIDGTLYTVLFSSLDETSWVVNNTSADYNEMSVAVTLLQA